MKVSTKMAEKSHQEPPANGSDTWILLDGIIIKTTAYIN